MRRYSNLLELRARRLHARQRLAHRGIGARLIRLRVSVHARHLALHQRGGGDTDGAQLGAPAGEQREATLPSVIAGPGIAAMPEFIVRPAVADWRLERILPRWSTSAA